MGRPAIPSRPVPQLHPPGTCAPSFMVISSIPDIVLNVAHPAELHLREVALKSSYENICVLERKENHLL